MYSSRNVDPDSEEFIDFFNVNFQLTEEMASTCEGETTLAECTKALSMMQNNKSPGSDILTTEFYRAFWDIISTSLSTALTTPSVLEIYLFLNEKALYLWFQRKKRILFI